jgi:hypothetical protein
VTLDQGREGGLRGLPMPRRERLESGAVGQPADGTQAQEHPQVPEGRVWWSIRHLAALLDGPRHRPGPE